VKKGKSGFTLIELVVAVGLMAVMFTALSVVFNQATGLMRRSEGEVALYQNFRIVYKAIRKDFESIVNYEEPVFYGRRDENKNLDPKFDYCGYMRVEDVEFSDGVNKNIVDNKANYKRVCDNISFLSSNPERMEIRNYLVKDASGDYVKNTVKGTDLAEITYAVEDGSGNLVKSAAGKIRNWRLMRYVRKVVDKSFVSNTDFSRDLYGLVYITNPLDQKFTGKGSYGMDVFNGSGKDNMIEVDFNNGTRDSGGRDPSPNKYGERAVLAEGCCGFDVKYWYFREDAPNAGWDGSAPPAPSGDKDDPLDPYTAFGNFYNDMPPNPANPATSGQPNMWYLPRMMQVRITLTDKFRMVEQDFFMRVHIPASNPLPKVQ